MGSVTLNQTTVTSMISEKIAELKSTMSIEQIQLFHEIELLLIDKVIEELYNEFDR